MERKFEVKEAITDEEISSCFDTVTQLRTHIKTPEELIEKVKLQHKEGYHLMYIEIDGKVGSICGFRRINWLYSGKYIYIDDLSTNSECRGHGAAGALLDYVINLAKEEKCSQVALDSGPTRNNAHRLYLNKRFNLEMHHFAITFNKE